MEQLVKLENLFNAIQETSDIRAKSQLFKMYRNCRKIATELSIELVECRRIKRPTARAQTLENELDLAINHLEQWVFFSKLLY
jgi:hypothetical protein